MEKIKIIIVDDHHLFRNGLRLLLEGIPEFEITGEASNGAELLDIIDRTRADIVLMDINMPVMDGVEATIKVLERKPEIKVIALSMYGEEDYYYRMTDAGARGFILKIQTFPEVREAINTVKRGGTFFSQQLLQNVIQKIKHREAETKLPSCRSVRKRYLRKYVKDFQTRK